MTPRLGRVQGKSLRWLYCGLLLSFAAIVCAAETFDAPDEKDAEPALGDDILELAVEQCLRGQTVQAQAIFKAIREQLDPPPSQLERIRWFESTGCQLPAPSPPVRWGVQLGAGYDNNVNQGILSQYMVLGAGSNAIELELGDAFKPQASAFGVAGVDASFRLGEFAVGQVALQQRTIDKVPALNLTTIIASVIRPFEWFGRPGRIQVDLGQTWLGGNRYQQAEAVGLQWLLADGEQPWLANVTTLRNSYLSQPDQDSQLTEIGVWREKFLVPTLSVFGGVSALQDHALRQRPGGDRSGFRFQLGVTTAWNEWLIQPRLNVLRWQSSEVYSPGLIDVIRHHHLSQLSVQLTRPIAPGRQLVVEWRINDARDTVPLFSYQSQSLGVYWRAQF